MNGTVAWTAPEVLLEESFRDSCDVYSFGVILWELFTGDIPWEGLSPIKLISMVGLQGKRLSLPSSSDDVLVGIVDIMSVCMGNEAGRPTFNDLYTKLRALVAVEERQGRAVRVAVPESFLCPIKLDLMNDPVSRRMDTHTSVKLLNSGYQGATALH